jgi:hypothetical protein
MMHAPARPGPVNLPASDDVASLKLNAHRMAASLDKGLVKEQIRPNHVHLALFVNFKNVLGGGSILASPKSNVLSGLGLNGGKEPEAGSVELTSLPCGACGVWGAKPNEHGKILKQQIHEIIT